MKKALLLLPALALLCTATFAQNTFPSSGDVGIGTSSPASILNISGVTPSLRIDASNNNAPSTLQFLGRNSNGGQDSKAQIIHSVTETVNGIGSTLDFLTTKESSGGGNFSSSMFINTFGNIGIGNTNPRQRLHLSAGPNTRVQQVLSDDNTASLMFAAGDSQPGTIASDVGLRFKTGVTYPSADVGGVTAMSIDVSGNVGIGITDPAVALHVAKGGVQATSTIYENSVFQNQARTAGIALGYDATNILGTISSTNGTSGLAFTTSNSTIEERMRITATGNVGIGTTIPDEKLSVYGKIHAQEVKVDLSVPGPDYVFKKDYNLPSLKEVETYISQNQHLPEIASAAEMKEKGIELGDMNIKLLKKIEELTLYMIQQDKAIAEIKSENAAQRNEIEKLKSAKP